MQFYTQCLDTLLHICLLESSTHFLPIIDCSSQLSLTMFPFIYSLPSVFKEDYGVQ